MIIIISGASSGVGKYLFDAFKSQGIDVIGTYNTTSPTTSGFYKVNIGDSSDVEKFISCLSLAEKDIVLINCAGISYNSFAHKADLSKWREVINVNLIGTFNMIHFLLPVMRQNGFGRIINFTSVVCKYPTPGISAYVASKSALCGLTKTLAVENASKGITVNSINLGYTNIGMGLKDVPKEYREKIIERIPMQRFCEPEEVLHTVKFIVDTPYLTGSIIDINGGII